MHAAIMVGLESAPIGIITTCKPSVRLAPNREVSSASATSGERKAAGLVPPFPQVCVAIISPSALRNSAQSLDSDRGRWGQGG